jgi:hypothetical protein
VEGPGRRHGREPGARRRDHRGAAPRARLVPTGRAPRPPAAADPRGSRHGEALAGGARHRPRCPALAGARKAGAGRGGRRPAGAARSPRRALAPAGTLRPGNVALRRPTERLRPDRRRGGGLARRRAAREVHHGRRHVRARRGRRALPGAGARDGRALDDRSARPPRPDLADHGHRLGVDGRRRPLRRGPRARHRARRPDRGRCVGRSQGRCPDGHPRHPLTGSHRKECRPLDGERPWAVRWAAARARVARGEGLRRAAGRRRRARGSRLRGD